MRKPPSPVWRGGFPLRRDFGSSGLGRRPASCMGWVKDLPRASLRRHYPDQVRRMFRSEDQTLSRKLGSPAPRRSLIPRLPDVTTSQTSPSVSRMRPSGKAESTTTGEKSQMRHEYAPSGMDIGDAEKVATILQERLASLIDLSLILKHVHWNVIGPGFVAVHELMDDQTESTRAMIDEVAERISTLGGVAAGLAQQVVDMRATDDQYALGRAPVMAHLGALDKVYETLGAEHRSAIEQVADIDPISEDLLVSQAGRLELNHWFIRAHISDTDGRLATQGTVDQLDAATAATYALQPDVASEEVEDEGSED